MISSWTPLPTSTLPDTLGIFFHCHVFLIVCNLQINQNKLLLPHTLINLQLLCAVLTQYCALPLTTSAINDKHFDSSTHSIKMNIWPHMLQCTHNSCILYWHNSIACNYFTFTLIFPILSNPQIFHTVRVQHYRMQLFYNDPQLFIFCPFLVICHKHFYTGPCSIRMNNQSYIHWCICKSLCTVLTQYHGVTLFYNTGGSLLSQIFGSMKICLAYQ